VADVGRSMGEAYYQGGGVTLHHGDCLDVMRSIPDNSVDAIVTDPPYGLGFMGKEWDALPPGLEWAQECLRVLKPGGHLLAFGGTRTWHRLAVAVEDAGFEIRDSIAWMHGQGFPKGKAQLKPAHEPVVIARKRTVAGTGLLNIEDARIGSGKRWPSNVILDEAMAAVLDEQSGIERRAGGFIRSKASDKFGTFATGDRMTVRPPSDGGASRFFYVAKPSKRERPVIDGVAHPTVKPLKLMRYLVRLVTPEGGTVLDPFAGSGTTIEAAIIEGFDVIGVERESEYLPHIEYRIERIGR